MSGRAGKTIVVWGAAVLASLLVVSCDHGPPDLTLTGVVTDALTGNPIAGARVADDGYGPTRSPAGATTDAAGRFSYLTWREEHSVIATALRHEPLVRMGEGRSGETVTVTFALVPKGK